jgi:hypothetical protein
MTYILILQLILGAEITTITTGFETSYPCYELAYRLNEGLEELGPQLDDYEGAERIARCYKATKSSSSLAPVSPTKTIPQPRSHAHANQSKEVGS